MLNKQNPLTWRAKAIALSLAISLAVIAVTGWKRSHLSRESTGTEIQRSSERMAILERISQAITPSGLSGHAAPSCPELANVKIATDIWLDELTKATAMHPQIVVGNYVFDPSRWGKLDQAACRSTAKDVDEEIRRSRQLLLAADSWRENSFNKSEKRWMGRYWKPHFADIETRDAWAILPGCIKDGSGNDIGGVCNEKSAHGIDDLVGDKQLAEGLVFRVSNLAQTATGRETNYHGKRIPLGQNVTLSLDAEMQSRASNLARCFVGETAACSSVLPPHLLNDWHYQPGMIRAGAAAVVLVQVRTGKVVAAAGAVSDCTKNNLARKAAPMLVGERERLPLFRPESDDLCPQIPDIYGAQGYLTISPLFWPFGPGSTMKTVALLAGIESGVVPQSMDETYRIMLARSHDPDGRQIIPQHLARLSRNKYVSMLQELGFAGDQPEDVILGGKSNGGWPLLTRSGFVNEPYSMDENVFAKIYASKMAGHNADAAFGNMKVAEYLKGYRLGISAVGSGDIRHTAWGLADWARRLALRAEGANSMAPTRLATIDEAALPQVPLNFARPASVKRLIAMLGGATASRISGTAANSCQAVFGSCPAEGAPAIWFSKTGTSETGAGGESSPWVKKGGAGTPPAKLYMAVFRGTDGELYAGGSMTIRIREKTGSNKPELSSNSAAEILMLLAAPKFNEKISEANPTHNTSNMNTSIPLNNSRSTK